MLGAVLPGLRDVRAPLAAGYLWFLAAWLALSDFMPDPKEASDTLREILDLIDKAGSVELGIAVSFAAYLIGALADELFAPLIRQLGFAGRHIWNIWLRQNIPNEEILSSLESESLTVLGSQSLNHVVRQRVDDAARQLQYSVEALAELAGAIVAFERREDFDLWRDERPRSGDVVKGLAEAINVQVVRDFERLKTRLLGEKPELFEEVDRHQAEAQLRRSIAPPLAVLVIVLAITWSLWWLAGVIAVVVLLIDGHRRAQRGSDLLADALLIGHVNAPVLERLERLADEIASREARRPQPDAAFAANRRRQRNELHRFIEEADDLHRARMRRRWLRPPWRDWSRDVLDWQERVDQWLVQNADESEITTFRNEGSSEPTLRDELDSKRGVLESIREEAFPRVN